MLPGPLWVFPWRVSPSSSLHIANFACVFLASRVEAPRGRLLLPVLLEQCLALSTSEAVGLYYHK